MYSYYDEYDAYDDFQANTKKKIVVDVVKRETITPNHKKKYIILNIYEFNNKK